MSSKYHIAEIKVLPSAVNASEKNCKGPTIRVGIVARSLAVATSQSLMSPAARFPDSSLSTPPPPHAEARVLPSGENPTQVIEFLCAGRVRARSFPVLTSQRITELGVISMIPPPVPIARVLPSGEKASEKATTPL